MMRIITGRARGTKLNTLEGDSTRPTAERTKEAVFSMVRSFLADACVLDLFAGSGQLGLEALSQGARRAVFCDASPKAMDVVIANAEKTHLREYCEFYRTDAKQFLKTAAGRQRFDIVFLDPPYALGVIPDCLELLLHGDCLAPGARIICETASGGDVFGKKEELKNKFEVLRATRYGAAFVTIITPKEREE